MLRRNIIAKLKKKIKMAVYLNIIWIDYDQMAAVCDILTVFINFLHFFPLIFIPLKANY